MRLRLRARSLVPGCRPTLTEPRHWRRAQDRLVNIDLVDGRRIHGRIGNTSPTDAQILTDTGVETVSFSDVTKAVVEVEFNHRRGEVEMDIDVKLPSRRSSPNATFPSTRWWEALSSASRRLPPHPGAHQDARVELDRNWACDRVGEGAAGTRGRWGARAGDAGAT